MNSEPKLAPPGAGLPFHQRLAIRTARVKPTGVPDAEEVLARFRELGPSIFRDLSAPGLDRKSTVRFHHPWFGPIHSLQWEWLLQAHTRIHLQQLQAIKKRL